MAEDKQSKGRKRAKLRRDSIQPEAVQLVSEAVARRYNIVPLEIKGNVLRVAMANPDDILALEALSSRSQMRIEPEAASIEDIRAAIDFNYRSYDEIEKQVSSISLPSETVEGEIKPEAVADAPVVKALSLIINEAVKARASDIHLHMTKLLLTKERLYKIRSCKKSSCY